MKKLCFTTATCFALFLPSITNAAPTCTGDCKSYSWSALNNTFICSGTCKCTATKTYTCYNPCTDFINLSKCGALGFGQVVWDNSSSGAYQSGTLWTCDIVGANCATAAKATVYRCNTGYYGNTVDGTTGCTSCADATGNPLATSVAGSNISITSCYVPANTEFEFSDVSGSGTAYFESDCSYTQ